MSKNYTSPLGFRDACKNGRHGTAPTNCEGQYKHVEGMGVGNCRMLYDGKGGPLPPLDPPLHYYQVRE